MWVLGRKIFEQLWVLKSRISETCDSGQSQSTLGEGMEETAGGWVRRESSLAFAFATE